MLRARRTVCHRSCRPLDAPTAACHHSEDTLCALPTTCHRSEDTLRAQPTTCSQSEAILCAQTRPCCRSSWPLSAQSHPCSRSAGLLCAQGVAHRRSVRCLSAQGVPHIRSVAPLSPQRHPCKPYIGPAEHSEAVRYPYGSTCYSYSQDFCSMEFRSKGWRSCPPWCWVPPSSFLSMRNAYIRSSRIPVTNLFAWLVQEIRLNGNPPERRPAFEGPATFLTGEW